MFEKIKKLLKNSNVGYKSYNMIICKNELHKRICKCSCHTNKGMQHITACCQYKVCPDCNKKLNVLKN